MANKHYYNETQEKAKAEKYLALGDEEFRLSDPIAKKLKAEILIEAGSIINGIIFYHKFIAYEPYEDLCAEANIALIGALERFNPDYVIPSTGKKVKLFNYFSLTAKRCLIYYTTKMAPHRYHNDIAKYAYLQAPQHHDLEDTRYVDDFMKIVTDKFGGEWKYKKIIPVLKDYLKMTGGIFNKREFYKFAHDYKITTSRARKFLMALKIDKEDIRAELL